MSNPNHSLENFRLLKPALSLTALCKIRCAVMAERAHETGGGYGYGHHQQHQHQQERHHPKAKAKAGAPGGAPGGPSQYQASLLKQVEKFWTAPGGNSRRASSSSGQPRLATAAP